MSTTTEHATDSSWLRDYYKEQRERAVHAGESMMRLTATLIERGVVRVTAEYDGCGDSGQIEDVVFLGAEDAVCEIEPGLAEEVEQVLYDLLEGRHGGWENNDGAFGSFAWTLASRELTHEHNDRFTDYETTRHEGFGEMAATEGDA